MPQKLSFTSYAASQDATKVPEVSALLNLSEVTTPKGFIELFTAIDQLTF